MPAVKVDIEELIAKLEDMIENGFVTTEVSVESDMWSDSLRLKAVGIEEDETVDYGVIGESSYSLS